MEACEDYALWQSLGRWAIDNGLGGFGGLFKFLFGLFLLFLVCFGFFLVCFCFFWFVLVCFCFLLVCFGGLCMFPVASPYSKFVACLFYIYTGDSRICRIQAFLK